MCRPVGQAALVLDAVSEAHPLMKRDEQSQFHSSEMSDSRTVTIAPGMDGGEKDSWGSSCGRQSSRFAAQLGHHRERVAVPGERIQRPSDWSDRVAAESDSG